MNNTTSPNDMLDATAAGRYLGYDRQPLELLAEHGHLAGAQRTAAGWRFRRGDIEAAAQRSGITRGLRHMNAGYVDRTRAAG